MRALAWLAAVLAVAALLAPWSPPATAAIDSAHLGARISGSDVTFRVYSAAATRMDVYVYAAPAGEQEKVAYPLVKDGGGVWSATVGLDALRAAGVTGTIYYGYRAWGPNWPYDAGWTKGSAAGFVSDVDAAGNRFDPNKLLLDPYAREISHDPLTPANPDRDRYGSGPAHRTTDTGPTAPKGIVLADGGQNTGTKPTRALSDDVVYEVNLRGLTAGDPSVPAAERGTYAGAARKAADLRALGVTAVEFLPLQETQNDTNDVDPTGTAGDNYWGYQTVNYFAPDRRYAADRSPGGPTREFAALVKAYHDAGLKVLVDVVYNHTDEGGPWSAADKNTYSVFSWRGLDNPTYYSLTADRQAPQDNTGVGGNVNTFNPVTQNLIVDSVAYWQSTLGVDGFRFDLAPVLGNTCEHGCFNYSRTNPGTALNRLTAEMPPRPATGGSGVDWIAEPWALGDGTYQVGNFPAGWSEWNGIYRDSLRRDQNKLGVSPITPGELATRFAGSSDLYAARHPAASVNFMDVHDGFTLKDLYSCNAKNNGQPWPYGPSDGGSDSNDSWDQGGDAAAQRRAARNGMAFLMLSAGVPMIAGGDEHLRSVNCNNNPYNLDSPANWLSSSWSSDQTTFATYTQRLIAFRAAHPALRPATFYTATQLQWFTPAGVAPDNAYWSNPDNHALAWRLDGPSLGDPSPALYVAYNGWSGDVTFTLPPPPAGRSWYRVTDTSSWAEGPDQVRAPGAEDPVGGSPYVLGGRAVLLLIAK
jgi:isoamylase